MSRWEDRTDRWSFRGLGWRCGRSRAASFDLFCEKMGSSQNISKRMRQRGRRQGAHEEHDHRLRQMMDVRRPSSYREVDHMDFQPSPRDRMRHGGRRESGAQSVGGGAWSNYGGNSPLAGGGRRCENRNTCAPGSISRDLRYQATRPQYIRHTGQNSPSSPAVPSLDDPQLPSTQHGYQKTTPHSSKFSH